LTTRFDGYLNFPGRMIRRNSALSPPAFT
jgi:hypothetical protein